MIYKVFFVIDTMLMLLIVSLEMLLLYFFFDVDVNGDNHDRLQYTILIFQPSLQAIFTLILIASAFYITNWVKNFTGRKQNACLFNWHVINLSLTTTAYFNFTILQCKAYSIKNKEEQSRFDFYAEVALLVSSCVQLYVDFFYLYLLYRFMKPKRFHQSSRTETSSLLFSRQSENSGELFFEELKGVEVSRPDQTTQQKNEEVSDFVMKGLVAEITTENAITLEFMN